MTSHLAGRGDRPVPRRDPASFDAGSYRLDPTRSTVAFTTRHLLGAGTVRGTFALRDGLICVTDPVESSWARARVDAGSFSTGHAGRDRNVRSPRLLDVQAHPDITFVSERLFSADGRWILAGSLSVRDTAAAVQLRVEDVRSDGPSLRIVASAGIDRYAFGITRYRGLAARHLTVRLNLITYPG
jgi:polyisoprenoid-binding protein YceI